MHSTDHTPRPPCQRPPGAPEQVAGVVFDCDGVLLDTETCWTRAQTRLFQRYGRPFGTPEKTALIGGTMTHVGNVLAQFLAQPDRATDLADELLTLAHAMLRSGVTAQPGAVQLLSRLHGRLPTAVASNAPRTLTLDLLARARLATYLDPDLVLGADDVAHPKPAPDLYSAACLRLGVLPATAVAIEDSPPGITAARAAGLYTIACPSWPGIQLDGDHHIDNLTADILGCILRCCRHETWVRRSES